MSQDGKAGKVYFQPYFCHADPALIYMLKVLTINGKMGNGLGGW